MGIVLKATMKIRKLLIPLNDKNAKNIEFAQPRYTPGTRTDGSLTAALRVDTLKRHVYIVQVLQTMKPVPLIRIDLSSQVPAYEQIAGEIRTLLVSGELSSGSPLPTVRQLALDLNVHHNTVAQAYRVLAAEGWLDLRRGRGVRVVTRARPPASGPKTHRRFQMQLKRLLAKAAAEGISPSAIAHQLVLHAQNVKNWAPAKGGS